MPENQSALRRLILAIPMEDMITALSGEEVQITVTLRIEGQSPSRYKEFQALSPERAAKLGKAIAEEATEARRLAHAERARKEKPAVTETEEAVIRAWNESEYILERSREKPRLDSRNFPVTTESRRKRCVKLIRQLVGELGASPDAIVASMGQYLDACKLGKHVFGGKNRGYKCLDGFLSRALKEGTLEGWWSKVDGIAVSDQDPDWTQRVADAFAARFLGQFDGWEGLENPSREYSCFFEYGARVREFAVNYGMRRNAALKLLLDYFDEVIDVKEPTPERLLDGRVWNGRMTAYLAALGHEPV